jgi:hypothetical protein
MAAQVVRHLMQQDNLTAGPGGRGGDCDTRLPATWLRVSWLIVGTSRPSAMPNSHGSHRMQCIHICLHARDICEHALAWQMHHRSEEIQLTAPIQGMTPLILYGIDRRSLSITLCGIAKFAHSYHGIHSSGHACEDNCQTGKQPSNAGG